MPVISVTRLRVRHWRFLPAFFFYAIRSRSQAARSAGNLGVDVLNDRNLAFWTKSAWKDEAAMRAFATAQPHLTAMKKLLYWCDESSVVAWTQNRADLPDWGESHRRLQAEGRAGKVAYPSAAHKSFTIPPPGGKATPSS